MVKLPVSIKLFIGGIGYRFFKIYMKISGNQPYVVNEDETIDYIKKYKCSVTRFGDGEFLWAFQKRQAGNFEKNSPELSQRLLEVLDNKNENLITCIPNIFNTLSGVKKKTRTYWEGFLIRNGIQVVNLLDTDKTYYDTQFTRPYMDYEISGRNFKKKFQNLKGIWQNRDVLIVEGEKTRFGIASDLLDNAHSISRIICPSENAFEVYNQILKIVSKEARKIDNVLVLASLGPAATVLAFDLSKKNIQTVDIGHLDVEYQWYKMGATEKVSIPGKYVNEADTKYSGDLSIDQLKKYHEEIINTIVQTTNG